MALLQSNVSFGLASCSCRCHLIYLQSTDSMTLRIFWVSNIPRYFYFAFDIILININICPIRMSLYIFLLYNIYHLCFTCTCIDLYDLSAWGGCWFVVYIRRFIFKFLNVCPFDYTAVAGSRKVGLVNLVNHTSSVTVVIPTDRPKSVRNLCVIKLFVALFVLSLCPFDISAGEGAFVIGLSQISSFFFAR